MRKYLKALVRADGEGLFGRAMSAGFWAAGLRLTLRLLIIVRTVILARLLSPDDFGLMAIATISILLLERFTESGFDSALVQKEDDINPYLDSAWTVSIVRGLAMAGILAVTAPLIARFFGAAEATEIIRVMALAVAIRGFANIGAVYFVKDLQFDKFFWLQISDKGTDVLVSIGIAIVWPSVWALVFGVLIGSTMRTIVSYLIHTYRPRLRWEWERIKELFHFGKWVLGQNVLAYVASNIDDILVGRLLGVNALGLYRMAYNFSQAMATEITQVTNQVAFPTYSKLQNTVDKLRKAYFGSLHLVAFVGMPLAIGTILVAHDFVIGVLGDQWTPMILALQLLSIAGLARGLGATTGPLFQSQGRPDIPPRFTLAKVVILAILLYPAITSYGIDGAAGVVAGAAATTGVAALWVAFRFVGSDEPQAFQAMGFPAINTAVMAVAVLAVDQFLPSDTASVGTFLILVTAGVAAYFGSVALTMRYTPYAAPSTLLNRIRDAAV